MRLILLLLLAFSVQAQPIPPALTLTVGAVSDRFEFAPIPEHVFIRGRAEKVQMGIWQLDPANRWTPGDQTRASGWTASRPTQLINEQSNQPVVMFAYDAVTAELTYAGGWSGDVTVHLETVDGAIRSLPFRIRVLTPTVVYGTDATAINATQGWGAVTCDVPATSFSACRNKFKGGASDAAPLVVFITAGRYGGQDWFMGARPYNYIVGEPSAWPTLVGNDSGSTKPMMVAYRNLVLENMNINVVGRPISTTINLSNIQQCCEGPQVDNGVVNANGTTIEPWIVNVWNFVSIGMGNSGNTNHAFYIEGRAKGRFEINNSQCRGAKGSSCFKTDMAWMAVRNSLICTTQSCTSVGAGTPAAGMTTHSMIDTPAAGTVIVYNNHFKLWKDQRGGPTALPTAYRGAYTPPVHLRLRQPIQGSDIPLYPDVSYDPPVSSRGVRGSPGGGWVGTAATFVNPAFWADVAARPDVFAFNHYISFNTTEMLPNSIGETGLLRDDGTAAQEAVTQFGAGRALRVPSNWRERSRTFLYGNTYVGYVGEPPAYQLKLTQDVAEVDPGAIYPRTQPYHFPTAVDVQELESWFKL